MNKFLFATILLLSQNLSAQENDILSWIDTTKDYEIYLSSYPRYFDERYNSGEVVGIIKWNGVFPMLNGTITYYTPDKKVELVTKPFLAAMLDSTIAFMETSSYHCYQGSENIYGYMNMLYFKPKILPKLGKRFWGQITSNTCDYFSEKNVLCEMHQIVMIEKNKVNQFENSKQNTSKKIEVNVFPNPTKDFISIEYNEDLRKNLTSFEIVNIQGKSKLTLSQNTECPISKINVSNLEKGIYILVGKNQNEQTIFSSKFEKH